MTEPGFLYDKSKAGGEPTLTGNIFDGRLSSLQSLACAPAPDRLFGATRAYTNSFNNREHVPELEHPGKFCQMSGGDLGRRDMSSFAPLPRAALANIQVQDLPIPSYYLIFHSAKKQVYLLRQFFQNFYSSSGMSNFLGKQYNACYTSIRKVSTIWVLQYLKLLLLHQFILVCFSLSWLKTKKVIIPWGDQIKV